MVCKLSKILIYLFTAVFIVCGQVSISDAVQSASSKKRVAKGTVKTANKGKKKPQRVARKHNREASVSLALNNLEKHLPDYYEEMFSTEGSESRYIDVPENFDANSVFVDDGLRLKLFSKLNDWLGTPYIHAGRTRSGVDCSNFTSQIVREVLGKPFPASPSSQAVLFSQKLGASELQFGDLIFFSGRDRRSSRIGHVGFYLGSGLFAHSASNHGVIYSNISDGYYRERFRFGGRLTNNLTVARL